MHRVLATARAVQSLASLRLPRRPRPFVLNHVVTVRCNLACPFCYISGPEQRAFNQQHYPRDQELSSDELCRFYRDLADAGFSLFVILGGEPLLRADLERACAEVSGRVHVALFTNGPLLAEMVHGAAFAEAACAGLRCDRGCRDWDIHDMSAIVDGRFTLTDLRRTVAAFSPVRPWRGLPNQCKRGFQFQRRHSRRCALAG